MKKLLPKRKPERKPSEEEFALRKSTAALEEDDQILKVIEAYCTSAKTRQTLNSSSRKESAPQVLLPEEEKIIIEETKSNGQTVIEKKSLIDTVYALKDEVQELRQDNKKDEEVSGGGAESPQRPGEAGEEGSEEHERPCLERDQPPKLPGSVSKTGQDTSPCDVQYCMAGLDDSCLPVHREAGGSQARRMHPGAELCQPSSVSISVTLFGNKGSDQPQALAFQVFTEYI